MRRRRAGLPVALVAAALAVSLAGCGGGDEGTSATSTEPDATQTPREGSPSLAPEASPTPSATPMPGATSTPPEASAPSAPSPPADATGPETEDEGGAGDESAARTPVRVVIDGEGITPPRVEVPAFLGVRVTVRNVLPRSVRVSLADGDGRRTVPAGRSASFTASGLQPGEHVLSAGVAGRAVVVAARP